MLDRCDFEKAHTLNLGYDGYKDRLLIELGADPHGLRCVAEQEALLLLVYHLGVDPDQLIPLSEENMKWLGTIVEAIVAGTALGLRARQPNVRVLTWAP